MALIDHIIPLSYGRFGFQSRSKKWQFQWEPDHLSGKTALVTGANSGIGFETAQALCQMGAHVYLAVRNKSKGQESLQMILKKMPTAKVELVEVDMTSLESIHQLCTEMLQKNQPIDILIHNAGAMYKEREFNAEGLEKTFVISALGPFFMNHLLTPILNQSQNARVIHVASGGMYLQSVDLSDIGFRTQAYRDMKAYAHGKRVMVILSELFAELWKNTSIQSFAMHPGWVDTPALAAAMPGFYNLTKSILRSAPQGADTLIWLSAESSDKIQSGAFYFDREIKPIDANNKTRLNDKQKKSIWDYCSRMIDSVYQK